MSQIGRSFGVGILLVLCYSYLVLFYVDCLFVFCLSGLELRMGSGGFECVSNELSPARYKYIRR